MHKTLLLQKGRTKMARIRFDNKGDETYKKCFGVGDNEIAEVADDVLGGHAPLRLYQNERYVIVGLGGQGVKAVDQIKKRVKKQFSGIATTNCRVVFAALDTNRVSLDQTGLEPEEKYPIQIKAGVKGRYNRSETIAIGHPRDPFTTNWINPNFQNEFRPDGSGQNRHVSKALFYDEVGGVSTAQEIEDFLRDRFTSLVNTTDRIRVFLITGIAGGTGSGAFVELAQMIRRAHAAVFATAASSLTISGYMYLPDVIEQYFNPAERGSIYANGYAALKELDYYYSAGQRAYGIDYLPARGYDQDWEVRLGKPLFDNVYLVSGSNGVIAPSDKNKQAIQTVAESIVNVIADTQRSAATAVEDDFRSVESNQPVQRTNVLQRCYVDGTDREAPKVCAEDTFDYMSVGTASLSIFENPIKMYIISRTMRTLSGREDGFGAPEGFESFRSTPVNEHTAEDDIRTLGIITPDDVRTKVRDFCRLTWRKNNTLKLADMISSTKEGELKSALGSEVEEVKQQNVTGGKARVPYTDQELAGYIREALTKYMKETLNETMTRMKSFLKNKGPIALKMLYCGDGIGGKYPEGVSIDSKIRLYEVSQFDDQRKDRKKKYEEAKEEGREKLRKWLGLFERDQREALQKASDAFRRMVEEDQSFQIAKHVFGEKGVYKTEYLDKISEFLDAVIVFAQTLDSLIEVYDNLGKPYADGLSGSFQNDDNATARNLMTDATDYRWADTIVQQKANSVEFQSVKDEIIDSFFKNSKVWTEYDPLTPGVSPRIEMDRIMQEKIDLRVSLKLTDLFANRLEKDPDWRTWLSNLLKNQLFPKAEPLYRSKDIGAVAMRSKKYLIVPSALTTSGADGALIATALQSICDDTGVSLNTTSLNDVITCYANLFALPLYSLEQLSAWEAAYEERPHEEQHSNESGRGIYDPKKGFTWIDYPNLCLVQNPRLPDQYGRISREGRFLKETIDPLFQDAKDRGLIVPVETKRGDGSASYHFRVYLMTKRGWQWKEQFNFNQYAATPGVRENGIVQGGAKLVEYLAKKNGGTLEDASFDICLANNQGKFTECNTLELAEARAKRVLRRNITLMRELRDTIQTYDELSKQINTQNEQYRYKAVGGDMLWLIAEGSIEKLYGVWYLQNYPNYGDSVQLLDTDPISVEGDWRFEGKYRFEYLALREAFVSAFGGDNGILERITQAKKYPLASDANGQERPMVKAQRRKQYTDKLNSVFKKEAEDAAELKRAENYGIRQELSRRAGKPIDSLLDDYVAVETIYQQLAEPNN